MKTIKTFTLVSILMFGMTTSVFASWWNPFTWNFFNKKVVPVQQVQPAQQNTVPVKENISNQDRTKGTSTPKNTESQNSKVSTYTNEKYLFSIDFPKDDPAKTTDYSSLHPFKSLPVVYSGYWITVNVSDDQSDVASCIIPGKIHNNVDDIKLDKTYTKKINGTDFAVSDWNSDDSYERNYTTLHNGKCFDIQTITVPSCSLCNSGRPSLESYKPKLDAMDKVAQTFRFTDTKEVSKSEVKVDGMSKYTDSDFGFSIWHPSNLSVKVSPGDNTNSERNFGKDTKVVKILDVGDVGIVEVYSPNMSIYGDILDDPSPASYYLNYFFDKNKHMWMVATGRGPKGVTSSTTTADISNNTMGGLHIFNGYTRFGIKSIIPLSAHNFLVVGAECNDATEYECGMGIGSGRDKFEKTIQTITATDPSVATPVSIEEQIKAIKAVAQVYNK